MLMINSYMSARLFACVSLLALRHVLLTIPKQCKVLQNDNDLKTKVDLKNEDKNLKTQSLSRPQPAQNVAYDM